ncbi:352_t:CDS:1, partial [Ambispora gerdemannii]
ISKIKSVDDAKNAEYNGQKLTSAEKAVFDHSSITNDLTKVKETAELLEKVIKAKAETKANSGLLVDLETEKSLKSDSYTAINSVDNNKYDTAITHLKGFGDGGDKTEEEYNKQIKAVEIQIAGKDTELEKIEAEYKIYVEQFKANEAKRQKIVNEIKSLKKFKVDLAKPAGPYAMENTNYLEKIIDEYVDTYTKKPQVYKMKISLDSANLHDYANTKERLYVTKMSLEYIAMQLFDMLREFGEEEMNEAIDRSSCSDPTKAKDIFKRLLKVN